MSEFDEASEAERTVKLEAKDQTVLDLSARAAELSGLVRNMLDGDDDDDEENQIPLPNVGSAALRKVIEFCEHHVGDPMDAIERPLRSTKMSDSVNAWYSSFVDDLWEQDESFFFEVMMAANYMEISPLLDLTCARFTGELKRMRAPDIAEKYQVDLEPSEIAQINDEYEATRRHEGLQEH